MQNSENNKPARNIFPINKDSDGQRVDNFLLKTLKDLNKSNIYKLLRKGQIRVNGKRTKPVYKLKAEDQLRIPPFLIPDETGEIYISDNAINHIRESILFENKNYLVINKPSGLAVHSGTGIRVGLIDICKRIFPEVDIQLAHRLDRDTSGCVVLSKNRQALNDFNAQKDSIIKKYSALAQGVIKNDFTVDLKLNVSNRVHGERTVVVDENGKHAKTKFIVSEYFLGKTPTTLLQCQLFTGRTHQIRVHTSAIDHPLAGDKRYGNMKFNKKMKDLGLKRIFLHASNIQFQDNEETILVSADLPDNLQQILDKL